MKRYLIVINIMMALCTQAQNTQFTPEQIQNLYHNVNVLQQRDSLKTELISELKLQITEYRNVVKADSIIGSMRLQQIQIQQQQIDLYKTAYEQNKRKWWEKPWIWFIAGSVSTTALTLALTR
jgi:hypothetical protein